MSERSHSRIVAFVDDSSVGEAVTLAAKAFAPVFGAEAEVVHVLENGAEGAPAAVRESGLAHRLMTGTVEGTIAGVLAHPDVTVGVVGARRDPTDERPTGHVALDVLARANTPIIVVPPESPLVIANGIERVMVPLDGTEPTARAVSDTMHLLAGSGVDVVAVHVFDADTVPQFWDRPQYEPDTWGSEFVERFCAVDDVRLRLQIGPAAERVLDVAATEQVDAIVLAWTQSLAAGRARVLWEILATSTVPVLVLPIADPLRAVSDPARRRSAQR